jgi:NAD(P)H-dependent flavin oxidoreductase YrpB (nitropropane dioxygenase family)
MMPKGMPEGTTLETVQKNLPREHKDFVQSIADKFEVPAATKKTFFNSVLRTPAYFEGQLEALINSDVNLVAFGVGLTEDAVARLRAEGKIVGALIGNPGHYKAFEHLDLDFIVAQGSEAGGHTGTIGTMVLVPEIVQMAGNTPVLAAGGIGHGSQIAASLAMGAQGVWLGSVWLATEEHSKGDHATSEKTLQKLFDSGSGDTWVTKGSSGKPQRQTRSAWTETWEREDAPRPLGMPYQHALVGDLLTAIEEYQIDPLVHTAAGQGVAWINEKRSVAKVVEHLISETAKALENSGRLLSS